MTLGEPEQMSGHLHLLTDTLGSLLFHGFPTTLPFVTASPGPPGLGPGNPAALLSLPQGTKIPLTYHGQQTSLDLQLRGQVNDTAER